MHHLRSFFISTATPPVAVIAQKAFKGAFHFITSILDLSLCNVHPYLATESFLYVALLLWPIPSLTTSSALLHILYVVCS